MAANLTPQFRRAEERYRQAQSPAERLVCLEEMLRVIPKHKGTDRLQGDLRARIKETRRELADEQSDGRAGSYRIPRQGAATAVIIGAPNSGKSRLLQELTNASPVVAAYPFTTREPLAAIMDWRQFRIQLIDTPPITENRIEAYLSDFVRVADLVLLCFNGSSDDAFVDTAAVVRQLSSRKTRLSDRSGFDDDDLTIVHVKTLLVITHAGDRDLELRLSLMPEVERWPFPQARTELERPDSVESLKGEIIARLELIRVHTRRPGEEEDPEPVVLRQGATVSDLAEKLHEQLAKTLRFAKVWDSRGAEERSVGRDFELHDGNIVELYS